ncbi:13483_t:CDS:2, partial [Racocetra persica]
MSRRAGLDCGCELILTRMKLSIACTGDWTKCESVLDVTQDTVNLVFGVLLHGTGQVWFNQFEFNVVSLSNQTTIATVTNSTPSYTTGELYYPVSLFGTSPVFTNKVASDSVTATTNIGGIIGATFGGFAAGIIV